MGDPGKAEEETEPSLCPKRAPHAAPGSNQPLVVGPCTSLQQEKAKLKADREMDSPQSSTGILDPTAGPEPERLNQKLVPRQPTRPSRVGFQGTGSIHDTVPCLLAGWMHLKTLPCRERMQIMLRVGSTH